LTSIEDFSLYFVQLLTISNASKVELEEPDDDNSETGWREDENAPEEEESNATFEPLVMLVVEETKIHVKKKKRLSIPNVQSFSSMGKVSLRKVQGKRHG
jgi:hypothetical protein